MTGMPRHDRRRRWRLQAYPLTDGTHVVDDAFANADLLPQEFARAERERSAAAEIAEAGIAEQAVDEFRTARKPSTG